MNLAPYLRALGLGAVSGMRSMTGPAAVRLHATDLSRVVVPLLALGELVVDKLPVTPSRTLPPSLIVRALAGGFAGGSIAVVWQGDRRLGALCGIAGAVAASYLFEQIREAAGRRTGLPDPVVALAEDALALGAGYALVRGAAGPSS
ncbi:MAG: DUF4126 family protein [Candidatus Velthaea sp.]